MSQIATSPSETLDLDAYRTELTGYCYRMLGSPFDADDAVQDTLLRAWQAWDRFEGRASVRSWLYRIATNVCLDRLRGKDRRTMPMDLSTTPFSAHQPPGDILPEATWVQPIVDSDVESAGDPADTVVLRDTIRLAFVAALQHLPPRQRVVLILREVLSWQASEVAELLDTTVASVNSALQRARATLDTAHVDIDSRVAPLADSDTQLLAKYVAAFEAYDIDALVKLLHHDASISMPPYEMWFRGVDELRTWYLGYGIACKGSRLIPVQVNGAPGFAQYRASGPNGEHQPWGIHVLEIEDGAIAHIHHFLGAALFERFGLPAQLN